MERQKIYGLAGYPVKHSYSKRYFEHKFQDSGLSFCKYDLFEFGNPEEIVTLIRSEKNLCGLNVTSPFKQSIIEYLDELDPIAEEIGSVNTIAIENGKTKGYNTDYLGFDYALTQECNPDKIVSAAILGSGGAASSVAYILNKRSIDFFFVSRNPKKNNKGKKTIDYDELNKTNFENLSLIVNATPCGMGLLTNTKAPIDTLKISNRNIVFDLIYNPSPTLLLEQSVKNGAHIIDGLKMLYSQAEYSWKIWNKQ